MASNAPTLSFGGVFDPPLGNSANMIVAKTPPVKEIACYALLFGRIADAISKGIETPVCSVWPLFVYVRWKSAMLLNKLMSPFD